MSTWILSEPADLAAECVGMFVPGIFLGVTFLLLAGVVRFLFDVVLGG